MKSAAAAGGLRPSSDPAQITALPLPLGKSLADPELTSSGPGPDSPPTPCTGFHADSLILREAEKCRRSQW